MQSNNNDENKSVEIDAEKKLYKSKSEQKLMQPDPSPGKKKTLWQLLEHSMIKNCSNLESL